MHEADDLSRLMHAVAKGDRSAFARLYDQVAPKLYGIALRICHDVSIAEDAVQDSFTEIWRKAGDFDPSRGRAIAWMQVIARNRAVDALRRHSRSGREQTGVSEEMLGAIVDPRQRADGGVEAMALAECLGQLDERGRQAVLRAYLRGESREELATRFDAPVNTIKTWLRRALASLRDCLGGGNGP